MFKQQCHETPGSLIASMLDEGRPPAEFLKGRGHVETTMPSAEDALKYCPPHPVVTISIPIVQVGKLRHKEVKLFAQEYPAY